MGDQYILARFIPGQGLKIINLQNLSQIWDGRDCNNEHCMSRSVIDASLDTIPKTRQFFSGLFCIEPTQ